jgi:hypothetical protein
MGVGCHALVRGMPWSRARADRWVLGMPVSASIWRRGFRAIRYSRLKNSRVSRVRARSCHFCQAAGGVDGAHSGEGRRTFSSARRTWLMVVPSCAAAVPGGVPPVTTSRVTASRSMSPGSRPGSVMPAQQLAGGSQVRGSLMPSRPRMPAAWSCSAQRCGERVSEAEVAGLVLAVGEGERAAGVGQVGSREQFVQRPPRSRRGCRHPALYRRAGAGSGPPAAS